MQTKDYVELGLNKIVYDMVQSGEELSLIAKKLGLRLYAARALFVYEYERQKQTYKPELTAEIHLSESELSMQGESFKTLYKPEIIEQYELTVKSRL